MKLNKQVKGENWVLVLNKYQRDNLLSLLNMVTGYRLIKPVEPFHLMNTGDWCGEILWMLGKDIDIAGQGMTEVFQIDENDRPNVSFDEVRRRINFWLKHRNSG